DDDVVLEDDPDVITAAEDDALVGGADGRVAEEDAGGHLADVVELHRGQRIGGRGDGCRGQGTEQNQQEEADGETHDTVSGSQTRAGERALLYAAGKGIATRKVGGSGEEKARRHQWERRAWGPGRGEAGHRAAGLVR